MRLLPLAPTAAALVSGPSATYLARSGRTSESRRGKSVRPPARALPRRRVARYSSAVPARVFEPAAEPAPGRRASARGGRVRRRGSLACASRARSRKGRSGIDAKRARQKGGRDGAVQSRVGRQFERLAEAVRSGDPIYCTCFVNSRWIERLDPKDSAASSAAPVR